eukprot:gene5231-10475_t
MGICGLLGGGLEFIGSVLGGKCKVLRVMLVFGGLCALLVWGSWGGIGRDFSGLKVLKSTTTSSRHHYIKGHLTDTKPIYLRHATVYTKSQ